MKDDNDKKNDNNYMDDKEIEEIESFEGEDPLGREIQTIYGEKMKTREEALQYGLTFEDAYVDTPFKDTNWQLVRVRPSKKAFLWTYEMNGIMHLNVKVDPDKAYFWRKEFASVQPGYHRRQGTLEYHYSGWLYSYRGY